MPVQYSFSGRLLRIELVGSYAPVEVAESFFSAVSDPACPPDAAFLLDARRSDELAARPVEKVQAIAEVFARGAERVGGHCAILTATPAQFGVARVGARHAQVQGVQVGVFTDEAEALAWLGLTPSRPGPEG